MYTQVVCEFIRRLIHAIINLIARVSPKTGKLISNATHAGEHRPSIATRDLRRWIKKVGLSYHSPHKFRHGHAVYALKNAKDVSALKAVSQNLMHENLTVTDGVYGVLSEKDVREQISDLGQRLIHPETQNVKELIVLTKKLLESLDVNGI